MDENCSACGQRNIHDDKYCLSCGTSLIAEQIALPNTEPLCKIDEFTPAMAMAELKKQDA